MWISIAKYIGTMFALSLNFLGMEYLLYSLLQAKSKLYYVFTVVIIALVCLLMSHLNKIKVFRTSANIILVLFSVLLGFYFLRFLI